ncbi:MAG: type VI secretion system baseplate subunit TssG [Alphaproteobacteria bacterium]|nr:type VI secretion system baseplate subunit TssG [Alphaproteobacteria bacterium]
MGAAVRNTKLPLIDELLTYPKKFSFDTAAYILGCNASVSFGKEMNVNAAPFKTASIYAFHLRATEIEKIEEIGGTKVIYTERLPIAGLNAPLPTPYTELLFRRNLDQDTAMTAFINAFNMRLLGISYRVSQRKFLNLQNHKKNCTFLKCIATLSGNPQNEMKRQFARLSYLFWTKEKSADGLIAILNAVLNLSANVSENQAGWIKRSKIQPLGKMRLGRDSELGTKISSSEFNVKIDITHSDFRRLYELITDVNKLNELKTLIEKYLGVFYIPSVFITPQNVPPLKMENWILGRNSWLPGGKIESLKII